MLGEFLILTKIKNIIENVFRQKSRKLISICAERLKDWNMCNAVPFQIIQTPKLWDSFREGNIHVANKEHAVQSGCASYCNLV